MGETIVPINRRTLLQRGLVILAGALGLEAMEAGASSREPVVPAGGETLRFYARRWQNHAHGTGPGELPVWTGRMDRQGNLLDAPNGKKTGEFYATCFGQASSFGGRASKSPSIELHTFRLGADSVFGMGSCGLVGDSQERHAVVGGTGRFAGAKGTYVVNHSGGGEYVEIVLTIVT